MLTRREKIIAVTVIIVTLIIVVYVLLTTYWEAQYINKKYVNPGLTYKDRSYYIYTKYLVLRDYELFDKYNISWRHPLRYARYNDLILVLNGAILKDVNNKVFMLKDYKISSVDKILNRINEFLSSIGLRLNYSYASMALFELGVVTPNDKMVIDYNIKCSLLYLRSLPKTEEYGSSRLIVEIDIGVSARSGAITMFTLNSNIEGLKRLGIVEDWSRLNEFVNMIILERSSDKNLHRLLNKLGFTEDLYRLGDIVFQPIKFYDNISVTYVGNIHDLPMEEYVEVALTKRISSELIDIRISTRIIPLGLFNIECHNLVLTEDKLKENALKFIREKLDIPEKLVDVHNIDGPVYYVKDIHTISNYYVVKAMIYTLKENFDVTLYIDPETGNVHDYTITVKPLTRSL